ncbi:sorting nexin-10A [Gouania willdenowi]|uniref:sorting nexin-10A n=1 Tax=Gouania willdenowi TaxID=441366 RepID=UPI0010553A43|nr:sorting nexin-10B-like [Gouania willdenowi]
MDSILENIGKTEFISVCVQDPRLHKEDMWHTYVDYEICLHTNSMCFRKKSSSVRRRYSEFVWLRQCLERNALIMELPKLPPWNPFFNLSNAHHVVQRMKGLKEFLENVLHTPLLLSDSRLHLFLQSELNTKKIEKCALGKTRYTVAEAIQRSHSSYISRLEDKESCDSDYESSSSSGYGVSLETPAQDNSVSFFPGADGHLELCSCLSESIQPPTPELYDDSPSSL